MHLPEPEPLDRSSSQRAEGLAESRPFSKAADASARQPSDIEQIPGGLARAQRASDGSEPRLPALDHRQSSEEFGSIKINCEVEPKGFKHF